MPKKTEAKTEANPSKSTTAPSFKQLARMINSGDRPRGLKAASNADGGVTFNYGPKSAPVTVIASKDELVAFGLASFGFLKLS